MLCAKLDTHNNPYEAGVIIIHDSCEKTEAQGVSNMPQVEGGRTQIYTREACSQSSLSEPLHTCLSNAHHVGPTQAPVPSRKQD